jgi:hypothetical protein
MPDRDAVGQTRASRGCLATGVGAAALVLLSPFVLVVRGFRRWRRGTEIRLRTDVSSLTHAEGVEFSRIDLELDVPLPTEPEIRRRLTDAVIRVAETLRASDDVYHLVYRLPWDEEPVVLPVGPQVQELGERFLLVQSQGAMAGRTAVWLTLGREHALSEVVDPVAYDPEADGEPGGLLIHPALRWSMATEWARVGPSLIFRLIFVVPVRAENTVKILLDALNGAGADSG